MFKRKGLLRISCLLLVVLQIMGIFPMQYAFAEAGVDDIPAPFEPEKRLLLPTKELFLDGIFRDEEFIKNWAYLAHYIGIGWCGGTESDQIGEDFSVKVINDMGEVSKYNKYFDEPLSPPIYVISANYDEDDDHADGYRADERLKMIITNADMMFDADTLEFGPVLHSKLEPEAVISKVIRNSGSTDLTSVVECSISDTESETITHGVNVGIKLGVKNTTTVKGSPVGVGADSATEVSFEINAGYNWAKANLSSHTVTKTSQERVLVPPFTKKSATIYALKSEASFPYVGDVQAVYNMTLVGFYRYKDNSEWGHDESRPDANVHFGELTSEGGLLATEDLLNQYINRTAQGHSPTDWQWIMDKYNTSEIKRRIGNISKQKYVARINGRFSQVDGCIFQSVIKDLGSLGPQDAGLGEQQDSAADPIHRFDPLTPPDTSSRVNLALNKTVRASDYLPNNSPEKAVNGTINNIDDCWKSEASSGSLDDWIIVDLGERRKIDYVSIANAGVFGYHNISNNHNLGLYVSDDGEWFTPVEAVESNSVDRLNFSLVDEDVVGRYVKIYVTMPGSFSGRMATCIYDLAIYGYDRDPDTYSITYSGNGNVGGNVPTDDNGYYQYTNAIVSGNTGNLERDGYDFSGWNTRADGSGEYMRSGSYFEVGNADINLYAQWIVTGDVAYMKNVTANHAISYHAASNAVNGTMSNLNDKWCTHNDTGSQWLEVDLGAEYDVNRWVVKHAGANGEDTDYNTKDFKLQRKNANEWVDVDIVDGNTENITDRSVNPFRSRFVRLYITNPTNNDDTAARIFQFKVFGERSAEDKYTVVYDSNGNLGGSAPVDGDEYSDNSIVRVLDNTGNLTKPGYRFNGWNTMPDGSEDGYNAGGYFRISDNTTFYAQWTQDTTIQNVTAGKEAVASDSIDGHPASNAVNGTMIDTNDKWATDYHQQWLYVDLGDTYEISRWVVKHAESGGESSDYNTSDYTLEKSNTGTEYTDFGTVDRVTDNSTAFTDREFTPTKARYVRLNISNATNLVSDHVARIFQFEVYGVPCQTVNYDDNGSTSGSVPGDTTYGRNAYSDGTSVTVLENSGDLVKTDYTLIGWNTEEDGTGLDYIAGDSFIMGTDDVTLYAQWERTNIALNKNAIQHVTLSEADASRAVDGDTNGNFNDGSVTLTEISNSAWWQVDLGAEYDISEIVVYNRTDNYEERLSNYNIIINDEDSNEVWTNHQTEYPNPMTIVDVDRVSGRYVTIQVTERNSLSLAEVQVYGRLSEK